MADDKLRTRHGEDYMDALVRRVAEYEPRSVLVLHDPAHARPERLAQALPQAQVTHLAAAPGGLDVLGTQTFDVAAVLCALEALPKAQAATMLGRLRDVQARRLVLAVRIGERWPGLASRWQRNDLIAYGLRFIGGYDEADAPIHLYRFDLYDYKSVPDWLNARNWAHPERWGKHRW